LTGITLLDKIEIYTKLPLLQHALMPVTAALSETLRVFVNCQDLKTVGKTYYNEVNVTVKNTQEARKVSPSFDSMSLAESTLLMQQL
jgi:hypothetical protein